MQPKKILRDWLQQNASSEHYLFSLQDLRALFPTLSDIAFKTLLSRAAAKEDLLHRVCRGIYIYRRAIPSNGLLLFHVAAYLRAHEFNYISLETALSNVGVISQVPINWITIMSSGCSNIIRCGEFGTIEFVHTKKKPSDILSRLSYDAQSRLWSADISLAISDMKDTHRNCDLIDWKVVNELI